MRNTWVRGGILVAGLGLMTVITRAQISVPNTFVANTVADPDQVNTNFSQLGGLALNRSSGSMLGTLSVRIVEPAVDATYALGSALLRFTNGYFSGQVQAASFAGSGAGLTSVPATQLTGLVPVANGGTGAAGPATAGSVPYGTGTTYAASTVGTAGQVLTSGGAGAPSWQSVGVPAGMIAFSTGACPTGWSEYVPLRGKYVVGTPAGGTLGGGAGTALTDNENRAVGQHGHTASTSIIDPGHDHVLETFNAGGGALTSLADISVNATASARGTAGLNRSNTTGISATTNVTTAGTVGGTNAPYLQLNACVKL